MNLSRAAKKFRDQMEPETPKRAKARKKAANSPPTPVATPEPVPVAQKPEPVLVPEPVAVAASAEPTPPPKKEWPAKAKRARFVREKAEKRERVAVPPLQLGSSKTTARLLTKNLALLPKDEPKEGRF